MVLAAIFACGRDGRGVGAVSALRCCSRMWVVRGVGEVSPAWLFLLISRAFGAVGGGVEEVNFCFSVF